MLIGLCNDGGTVVRKRMTKADMVDGVKEDAEICVLCTEDAQFRNRSIYNLLT